MDPSRIASNAIFRLAYSLIDDKILFSGLKQRNDEWLLIDDISLAVDYATSQYPRFPADIWLDLREKQAAEIPFVKGLYQEWENGVGLSVYEYLVKLDIPESVLNDIDGDLYNICRTDHRELDSPFWQKLREAYLVGGWPCGWSGSEYPIGRLVVFNPSTSSTL